MLYSERYCSRLESVSILVKFVALEMCAESICLPAAELSSLTQANNYLAVNLYKLLAKDGENIFFSPFSLSTALAMLFCAARNETSLEIRRVLGYEIANITDVSLVSAFQQLLSALEKTPDDYVISFANSLLSQKNFAIKDDYKLTLKETFKALMMEADFVSESEKIVNHINEWVKSKTNNMISQLLDSLDLSTVLIILNAVYFKGTWLNQFKKRLTRIQSFYSKGIKNNAKQVNMMHLTESFLYLEKESFRALLLPYKGEELAMLVLLPNSINGLEELENQLSSNFIQDIKREMCKRKVKVAFPKFQLNYTKSMKESFQSLGLERVFKDCADLSGMSDSKQLKVSEIIHKAVVVVNEEGTEAAAATAVAINCYSLSFDPQFIVDHPFTFVIYNTISNLIMFMGRVEDLE
ncbi:serpin B6-like [Stegodyphus dumicola]|uniref:serpin B6-like n=1 Tax=Stegodyphus dumicola TaxID=202533 RepID=UPI0015AFEC47|nr:serpin B6-like [Stegodyphus dumicola]